MIETENLLIRFWANYPTPPSEHEKQSLTAWAVELNNDEILAKVLDPSRHPRQSSGSIPKPNLATLKDLAWGYKRESRAQRERSADSLATADGCFYCNGTGFIHGIDRRTAVWCDVVFGRCKKCGTNKGSGWLEPHDPPADVIEFARAAEVDCVYAIGLMIDAHYEQLAKKPNMGTKVPF